MIFSDVQTQQCHCVFAYRLQTNEEEHEVPPHDAGQLKEDEQRDRTYSGIVNPGMEARKKCLLV